MTETKSKPDLNYTVVARRYRPKQFRDLIGQEPVAQALTNAIATNRVAHAYLFTGARGVGKTSAARILAKALNCQSGPTPTPCDECDICKSISLGEDIDVLEIDGASNRGIDEIRAIRQNVSTRPSRSRHKIYIVDEVHMLTAPAFNALLKTLEEPPPHVKFIFATTEVQKIPVTILSRCQRFDFAGIGAHQIAGQLRQIVEAEGMQAEDEALQLIARRAGGSMRDAQSLLDQLLAFSGERLTAELVHRLLGTATDDRVMALAEAVLAHDPPKAVKLLSECADEGLQLGELLDQLIEYWRALMLINCAGGDWPDLPVLESSRETLNQHAKAMTLDTILAGLDVLSAAKSKLRYSNHGQLLLEMALIRLSRLEELLPVAQLAQTFMESAGTIEAKKKPVIAPERNGHAPARTPSPAEAPKAEKIALTAENVPVVWSSVLNAIGGMMQLQLQRAGVPAILGPKTLMLRFPEACQGDYDVCKEPERVQRIESVLQRVTGEEWSLRVELSSEGEPPHQPKQEESTRNRTRQAMENPLLKRAMEVFDAKLLKVDPEFGTDSLTTSDPEE